MWIDSHCHLDAPEWTDDERRQVRAAARAVGVSRCVYPAVERANWPAVQALAHATGDAYALGIHPLYVPQARDDDVDALDEALATHQNDPRLVAVGEIGLDLWVPALCTPAMRERQERFYVAQLRLARRYGLPVILHVRRSADRLLKYLRMHAVPGGIAHAFNGSLPQAQALVARGFCLGFGGAMTFESARQLRHLACTLPLNALVLETDAPDIPPQWRYVTASRRAAGEPQAINSPAELPRIGAVLAALRGQTVDSVAQATTHNVRAVLPRLEALT